MGCQCSKDDRDGEESSTERKQGLLQNLSPCLDRMSSLGDRHHMVVCRLSDLQYKKKIGCGRYSRLYRAVEKRSNTPLVVKEICKAGWHSVKQLEPALEKEHLVMSKLRSRWLVEILQSFETLNTAYLLLPLLPGPSLLHVAKSRAPHNPRQLQTYAAQMVLCVYTVHSHGYMHRDVKLSNFLLDHLGNVKLGDFNSCVRFLPRATALQVFPESDSLLTVPDQTVLAARQILVRQQQYRPRVPHGTSYYCAPEVLGLATVTPTSGGYSYLCDFWSLGICLYYLAFRHLPFYCDYTVQLPRLIRHWRQTLKFPRGKVKNEALVSLIRGLLRDEASRLGSGGIQEVTTHPFFSSVRWDVMRSDPVHHWRELVRRLTDPLTAHNSANQLAAPAAPPPARRQSWSPGPGEGSTLLPSLSLSLSPSPPPACPATVSDTWKGRQPLDQR